MGEIVRNIYKVFYNETSSRIFTCGYCGLYISVFCMTFTEFMSLIMHKKLSVYLDKPIILAIMFVSGLICYFGPASKIEANLLENGKFDIDKSDTFQAKAIFAGMGIAAMALALINKKYFGL